MCRINAITGKAKIGHTFANSTVSTIVVNGSTVYFGGAFDFVGDSSRNYIAAVDINGTILSFNPNADSDVLTLSLDGNTMYVVDIFLK